MRTGLFTADPTIPSFPKQKPNTMAIKLTGRLPRKELQLSMVGAGLRGGFCVWVAKTLFKVSISSLYLTI